jgi:hypothetical protein
VPCELHNASDHDLKDTDLVVVMAGSHVRTMVKMQEYEPPLCGRFTSRLPVEPLPFATLAEFLPEYRAAQRVAVYANVGSIPAYLERFAGHKGLAADVVDPCTDDIFRPGQDNCRQTEIIPPLWGVARVSKVRQPGPTLGVGQRIVSRVNSRAIRILPDSVSSGLVSVNVGKRSEEWGSVRCSLLARKTEPPLSRRSA